MNFRKIALVTLCLVVAGGLFLMGPAAAKKPYKVGALFSVTGPASFLGQPEKNTALMIEKMVNAAGGINGHPLKVIVYDTEGSSAKAVILAKRLIQRDKVLAIIGPSCSGPTLAVVPIVNAAKVPLISCAASKKIGVPVAKRKWVFKVVAGDDLAVEMTYAYMKKKGIKKIGIMSVSTGYGKSGRDELIRLAPKFGIKIVADEVYGPKDNDLTPILTKIRASGAQAVLNWSIGPTQIVATRNHKQLGMKIPLYQSYGFGNKRNITMSQGAAEGVVMPSPRILVATQLASGDPQRPVVNRYKNLYEKTFKKSVSLFGGHAWDSLWQVVAALKKVGPSRAKIRAYLENMKGFVGNNGVFKRSASDHVGLARDAYIMVEVKNGNWSILKH
jgi:branched-chain amino acid transport system substrate-binding protein